MHPAEVSEVIVTIAFAYGIAEINQRDMIAKMTNISPFRLNQSDEAAMTR